MWSVANIWFYDIISTWFTVMFELLMEICSLKSLHKSHISENFAWTLPSPNPGPISTHYFHCSINTFLDVKGIQITTELCFIFGILLEGRGLTWKQLYYWVLILLKMGRTFCRFYILTLWYRKYMMYRGCWQVVICGTQWWCRSKQMPCHLFSCPDTIEKAEGVLQTTRRKSIYSCY